MPIALQSLVKELVPSKTVLFFGAGSSVPSGCPTAKTLIERLIAKFGFGSEDMSLAELSGLIELKTRDRRSMIEFIRVSFQGKRPTRGLLTLPLMDWRSLYTTNYDELIEKAYEQREKGLVAFSSDFDFSTDVPPSSQRLYKIHGTLGKDRSDGHQASLILTDQDYDNAKQNREFIYDRLASDLASSQLLIIGYSLADPEIKKLITRVLNIQAKIEGGGRQYFLSFSEDEARAEILESRGFKVSFGSIDDFFAEVLKQGADTVPVYRATGNPLDAAPAIIPITDDVKHAIEQGVSNVSAMFSGRPATYADIAEGLTFERDIVSKACDLIAANPGDPILVAGASGVGKTTAARQILTRVGGTVNWIWEHRTDNDFDAGEWLKVAVRLRELEQRGCLFIDDAHLHLQAINELADHLSSRGLTSLNLVLAAPRNSWNPRIKSPSLSKSLCHYKMSQLGQAEIDRLLNLAESVAPIRKLVQSSFSGFSRIERRRRLVDRCEADTFVCLKNIFASDGFDDIILAEYAALSVGPRDVYRVVAFLETSGVVAHRQLLIRLLGIPADVISAMLVSLMDIVFETEVDRREGVYAWRGRHAVISSIIAKYKFSGQNEYVGMLERVIQSINPTFTIELRSIRELCGIDGGIARVAERAEQNRLLRMMISVAPGERVPRHRLIRNLIAGGEFEKASTEIRIFKNDFGMDGPASHYQVRLMIARAMDAPGLLHEDRLAIMDEAVASASRAAARFTHNKSVLYAYCEAGLAYFKLSSDLKVFDSAILALKAAEETIGDADIPRMVAKFEERIRSSPERGALLVEALEADAGEG